ncbi:cell division topological specificity factor MinE [Gluconacetobacter diazotrophicus PA1 5]|uniref:Cell division topological specificity factor n=1 Tax=Gluconacetobacter diazotrophicus TaxID=33996 RepID=A0A7W4I3D9_GLUDI|nr:cell division topological specificity factor MinE [Gluconacetobacter diazotrophicus]ACI50298.1 cell division topological specificity factor MinE [Gluconacetobacter diazotrophicus PA1 5]MBB2154757.1 cell division topological specificity factor MinE [Gluconacetobacter diazotrophicus]TWB08380.1 cell division topological specificity factor [Gluconacetobacter diazotrophicus]
MSLLASLFGRKTSAPVARDRLQILLAHERSAGEGQSELIAKLQEEILAVITRHITVDQDKVQIKMDRGAGVSMLEIDIEVPELKASAPPQAAAAPR